MKILVVEDREEFMNAAKNCFMWKRDIEVTLVSSYEEAQKLIASTVFDGALIDVFMPAPEKETEDILSKFNDLLKEKRENLEEELKESREQGNSEEVIEDLRQRRLGRISYYESCFCETKADTTEAAVGIFLAETFGKEKSILVTSQYHHAKKFEMANMLISRECFHLWEGNEGHKDGEESNSHRKNNPVFWQNAYAYLMHIIDPKNNKMPNY